MPARVATLAAVPRCSISSSRAKETHSKAGCTIFEEVPAHCYVKDSFGLMFSIEAK